MFREELQENHSDKLPSDFYFLRGKSIVAEGAEEDWTVSEIVDKETQTIVIKKAVKKT